MMEIELNKGDRNLSDIVGRGGSICRPPPSSSYFHRFQSWVIAKNRDVAILVPCIETFLGDLSENMKTLDLSTSL